MGAILRKFFADRGTHLAAMIAYFALLSFVPLLFLSLALLGTADQADSGLVLRARARTGRSRAPRSTRSCSAVRAIQDNATALGIVGAAFLLWSSLSLFSVLESAFNIVYDRPNRPFLRGKALATLMMVGSLAVPLRVARRRLDRRRAAEALHRASATTSSSPTLLTRRRVSLVGIFVFLASAYVVLTNVDAALARGAAGRGRRRGRCSRRRSSSCPPSSASRSTTRCCRRSRGRPCCSSGST